MILYLALLLSIMSIYQYEIMNEFEEEKIFKSLFEIMDKSKNLF